MTQLADGLIGKSIGCMIGFAIGDALGFPSAGINITDLERFIEVPVIGFQDNPQHPFFAHLKPGNYTDITKLVIVSAENILRNQGFDVLEYTHDLKKFGKTVIDTPQQERWMGPTTMQAFRKLLDGADFTASGSTTTRSCACAFRVIPLSIYYRDLYRSDFAQLAQDANTTALITHNSMVSRTGAQVVSLIVAGLFNGCAPQKAVEDALEKINDQEADQVLINRIRDAILLSQSETDKAARKYFGTGSPMIQTLPLALFYFLKYQNDFEQGILAAANSFRDDEPEEAQRVSHLPWKEQLKEAIGGCTDGVAALVGTFLGTHLGFSAIPEKFMSVENLNYLEELAVSLVDNGRTTLHEPQSA